MLKKLIVFMMFFTIALPQPAAAQTKDAEKQKIEKIVRDYILENPEIIYEAIQILQQRDRMAKAGPAIASNQTYLYHETGATEAGNPKGDVTIVEFFDYRCGYCKRHYSEIKRLLKDDPGLRIVYKQYPILDYNDDSKMSRLAAYGAFASNKQGKFALYHDKMMTMKGSVTEESIQEVAQSIGLDMLQFNKDLKSKLFEKQIMNALYMGQALELSGTPAYVIGKTIIDGAQGYDTIKAAVVKARSEKAK